MPHQVENYFKLLCRNCSFQVTLNNYHLKVLLVNITQGLMYLCLDIL